MAGKYRVYQYKGKFYCEKDLSVEDENYAGDLYDLYFRLQDDDLADETTMYYSSRCPEATFYTAEELIENAFENLAIGVVMDG